MVEFLSRAKALATEFYFNDLTHFIENTPTYLSKCYFHSLLLFTILKKIKIIFLE